MWVAEADIEGWGLLVYMQAGIACTGLLHCLVPDMICRRVWCLQDA